MSSLRFTGGAQKIDVRTEEVSKGFGAPRLSFPNNGPSASNAINSYKSLCCYILAACHEHGRFC